MVFGQAPVPNFTANTTSGCGPLTVTFTDQSSGNPTAWNWEFSNGTLSSVQNPVVTFANPGTYSVKLVVQNASGIAQVEKINYITVQPTPSAEFSTNTTLGCVPVVVNFTDLSYNDPSGSIVSWEWQFGDGSSSSLQNPVHTYSTTGIFTISLTVTNNNGCKQTITKGSYIRIVGSVSTDFTYSSPSTCRGPFDISFQNQSLGPGTITQNWDFGNGQTSTAQNPVTTYTGPGTYTIKLNTQSSLGCTGFIEKTITLNSTSTDFTAPSTICLNQPVNFQNASSGMPLTANWDFGDGTTTAQINPIKTYLTPGTYDVRLINRYANCIDSVTKTVTVNDKPIVDFAVADSNSCSTPFTAQFTDLTPGATSWLWDFGDGTTSTQQNPSHQYNTNGNFTVTLTASTATACTNSLTKTALIDVQPVSIALQALSDGGCAPFTYIPRAVIETVDSIVSYQWDLGIPGAIFNVKDPPPFTYTSTGTYTVSLTVTTAGGCTQTLSVPAAVRVGTPLTPSFTANPLNECAVRVIQLTDQTTIPPGSHVEWEWDFGDGTEHDFDQNPTHVFLDTGAVTVTLTVRNNGCPAMVQQVLHVKPPVADFKFAVDCITKQVTFTDLSLVDPALSPLTYSWRMGNPANTSYNTTVPPPFTYPGPGIYNVVLFIQNGACSFETTKQVVIANELADFSISKNPVCRNQSFTLTAINSNPANISSYIWTIGGRTLSATTRSVTDSIAVNGTYDVTLTLTDINGCITTKTVSNYITVTGPTADFASSTPGGCENRITTFTDLSIPAGSIRNWSFDFGDGTRQTFTAAPLFHIYTRSGHYPVTMTVTDANGCTDSHSLPVDLLVTNLVAGFMADTFYCPNAPLQFRDTSSGAALTYLWDFGDGGSSTLQNPTHSYPTADADYTVKLNIRDISGCLDSVTKVNYVKIRSPHAAFDIQDTTTLCPPLLTSFTFQGTNYQSFNWQFGDGGSSTLPNPRYFYNAYGDFIPTLYVLGPGGCIDSAKSLVNLHDPAEIQINYGPNTTACNSLNVDFDLVVPPGFRFVLFFGDGSADSSRRTSLSHFYERPGFNSPYLVIVDSITGCVLTIGGRTRIDVMGAVPLFGMDKSEFCTSGIVTFTDFTTKNEPIISTNWDFGDGTSSSNQSPVHTFTQPGTYIVQLSVTTQSNCTSSYRDTVLVYRVPQPIIQGRDTICVNTTENFMGNLQVADTAITWKWNMGNGQTSTIQNPSATYTTTGDYTLQLITSNKLGCSDTTTKNIYVSPLPVVKAVQTPITIISGAGTNLLMDYSNGVVAYNWLPTTNLNCTNCPTPFASPQFTTKYNVGVVDRFGCKSSGDIEVIVVCTNQNFFVPNTFSPNGDDKNEVFYPRGRGLFRIKSMTIFNRWGQVMYDRKDVPINDPAFGWDGTFKGQKASPDVYVYMIEILCDNNTVIPLKGNITLLR